MNARYWVLTAACLANLRRSSSSFCCATMPAWMRCLRSSDCSLRLLKLSLIDCRQTHTTQLNVIPSTCSTIHKCAHLHAGIDVVLLVVVELCKLSGNALQLLNTDPLCLHVALKGLMELFKCLCGGEERRKREQWRGRKGLFILSTQFLLY